ncbi:MAG: pilus assembly protein PilM [Candidatus Paceibacterota bacterium]
MLRSTHKANKIFSTPIYLEMPSFGLDISDDSIKYMELVSSKNGIQTRKYGEKKIPNGVVELGKIIDKEKLEEIILDLKKEVKIKDVRVSILENQIYLFKLKLDKESISNVKESIELVLEEHIPIPASEAIFDYDILEETEHKLILQVGAIQVNIIEDYLAVFENCAINVHSFELEAQAIARSIIKKEDKDTYMIIDFGERRTGIFIVSGGIVMFTSTVDFGGVTFSEMIQKNLNISFEEAEKIKITYGLQRNLENKEIFPILLNGASILRDEIQKNFMYWHTHEDEDGVRNPPIKKILLCGGNSSIIGLADYFAVSMKTEVEIANVWSNICDLKMHIPSIPSRKALSFATAIGLSLRDFEHD